jgi:hypothetical protein
MTAVTAVTTNFQPSSALPSSLLSESLHADPAAARAGHPSVSCPRRCPNVASPASHRGVVGCGPWAVGKMPWARGSKSWPRLDQQPPLQNARSPTTGYCRPFETSAYYSKHTRGTSTSELARLNPPRDPKGRVAWCPNWPSPFSQHLSLRPATSDLRPATCDLRAPTFVLQHGSV